ncbi:hypothetical protein MTO96_020182 [Rhipicephalus appendiculatus]
MEANRAHRNSQRILVLLEKYEALCHKFSVQLGKRLRTGRPGRGTRRSVDGDRFVDATRGATAQKLLRHALGARFEVQASKQALLHRSSSLDGTCQDGAAVTGFLVPSNALIEIDRPVHVKTNEK